MLDESHDSDAHFLICSPWPIIHQPPIASGVGARPRAVSKSIAEGAKLLRVTFLLGGTRELGRMKDISVRVGGAK